MRHAAQTLHALGVRRGDTVALMLRNRPEHLLADLAAVHLGAVPFSIYAISPPAQVEHLLRDSGARMLICEAAFEPTVAAVAPRCDGLEHVLRVTSGAPELDGLESPGFDFEQSWRAVTPSELVCLVYTSGTTGPPKGVEITHANVLVNLRGTWRALPVPDRARVFSFLPLAHFLERLVSHYSAIVLAGTVTCCPDGAALPAALAESRPTVLCAPPRVWEKLRAACQAVGSDPAEFVRTAGLGELRLAVASAAPVPVPLLEFFQAAGVPLRQGWGITELGCVGTITTTDPAENGTCGRPIDGLELRIAPDGEVLARGPMVIRGYRNLPQQTAEAIDPQGWLHTGHLGWIDPQGRLTIVERNQELIISSAAKNMCPAKIEAEPPSASSPIGGPARAARTGCGFASASTEPGQAAAASRATSRSENAELHTEPDTQSTPRSDGSHLGAHPRGPTVPR